MMSFEMDTMYSQGLRPSSIVTEASICRVLPPRSSTSTKGTAPSPPESIADAAETVSVDWESARYWPDASNRVSARIRPS